MPGLRDVGRLRVSWALVPGLPFLPPRPPRDVPLCGEAVVRAYPDLARDLLGCRDYVEVAQLVHGRLPADLADGEAEALFGAILASWWWLRDGRRCVLLEDGARGRLAAAPEPLTLQPITRALSIQWTPRPEDLTANADAPFYVAGAIVYPPNDASRAAGHVATALPLMLVDGDPGGWRGRALCGLRPGPAEAAGWSRLIVRAFAALADRRVSQVVSLPSPSRAVRHARRRGLVVERLVLTPDAEGVWATHRIGPPLPAPSYDSRGPVALHHVHEHTARWWLRPGEDGLPTRGEVELDEHGLPLRRGQLVAARLPRRGHVRGEGAGRCRVTRVTMERSS